MTDMDFEPLLLLSHQQSNEMKAYFQASVVKNIDHRESHLKAFFAWRKPNKLTARMNQISQCPSAV